MTHYSRNGVLLTAEQIAALTAVETGTVEEADCPDDSGVSPELLKSGKEYIERIETQAEERRKAAEQRGQDIIRSAETRAGKLAQDIIDKARVDAESLIKNAEQRVAEIVKAAEAQVTIPGSQ